MNDKGVCRTAPATPGLLKSLEGWGFPRAARALLGISLPALRKPCPSLLFHLD